MTFRLYFSASTIRYSYVILTSLLISPIAGFSIDHYSRILNKCLSLSIFLFDLAVRLKKFFALTLILALAHLWPGNHHLEMQIVRLSPAFLAPVLSLQLLLLKDGVLYAEHYDIWPCSELQKASQTQMT